MNQRFDDLTAFLSGLVGAILAINLMDITWDIAWENLGRLLWLGFVALFSGAMGVLGKHLISKLIRLWNKKPKNGRQRD